MVGHAVILLNLRLELIILTSMPYAAYSMHQLYLIITVMVSLALKTTNAQTEATIVLVIDYAQIFQVHSAVHAE